MRTIRTSLPFAHTAPPSSATDAHLLRHFFAVNLGRLLSLALSKGKPFNSGGDGKILGNLLEVSGMIDIRIRTKEAAKTEEGTMKGAVFTSLVVKRSEKCLMVLWGLDIECEMDNFVS